MTQDRINEETKIDDVVADEVETLEYPDVETPENEIAEEADADVVIEALEADAPQADEATRADIEAEADALLADIESTSAFKMRQELADETFITEDDDLHPEEMPDTVADDEFADTFEEDPLGEDIVAVADGDSAGDLPEELQVEFIDEEDAREAQAAAFMSEEELLAQSEKKRHRLRNTLIVVIVILALIAAALGVLMWRNSLSPNVKEPDTVALSGGASSAGAVQFAPLEADQVPDFASFVGKSTKDAANACDSKLALGKTKEASDDRVKSLKKLQNGTLVDDTGATVASIAFGLNEDDKIVYVYASYDLDALGVAGASIEELAHDGTIAQSLLAGAGLDVSKIDTAKLALAANQTDGITGSKSEVQKCVFKGSTGRDKAPKTYVITESYDGSTGAAIGDNSVIRTMTLELY